MKNKYGIGFFIVSILIVLLITGAYQLSFLKAKDQAKTEIAKEEEQQNAKLQNPSVSTEGQALKEDCYYLKEVNGYVVVYLSDKKTAYEYTDIEFDGLPSSLQEEIRNGKYIEDSEALYGFLENYSS